MPVKGSRLGRSSSFGDAGIVSLLPESRDLRWNLQSASGSSVTKGADQNHRRRIFTISSPARDLEESSGVEEGKYGDFLEKCYYCCKKFDEKDDIFMYSYLKAFCSPECRVEQVKKDNNKELAAALNAPPPAPAPAPAPVKKNSK